MKELTEKYRVLFILILSLLALPACLLTVIGVNASGTAYCQNCLGPDRKVLELSFSELTMSPEKYTDQILRLDAIFDHDAGYTSLRNPADADWKKSMPVGFGKTFASCAATQKAITFHTGLGAWYDGRIQVKVIGKFGMVDDQRNFQTGQTGFTLLCIEQVKPANTVKEIAINTIRYSLSQVGKWVFHPLRST